MNETNAAHERIEQLLKQARVPEPSNPLKDRVTVAARQAWEKGPADVPWRIPVRRLALSAAAAALIVSLANHFANFDRPGAHPESNSAASVEIPYSEAIPEAAYAPLVKRRVYLGRQPAGADASTLRRYVENIEKILDEMEDNGTVERPTPRRGGSRLLPGGPPLGTYS